MVFLYSIYKRAKVSPKASECIMFFAFSSKKLAMHHRSSNLFFSNTFNSNNVHERIYFFSTNERTCFERACDKLLFASDNSYTYIMIPKYCRSHYHGPEYKVRVTFWIKTLYWAAFRYILNTFKICREGQFPGKAVKLLIASSVQLSKSSNRKYGSFKYFCTVISEMWEQPVKYNSSKSIKNSK